MQKTVTDYKVKRAKLHQMTDRLLAKIHPKMDIYQTLTWGYNQGTIYQLYLRGLGQFYAFSDYPQRYMT